MNSTHSGPSSATPGGHLSLFDGTIHDPYQQRLKLSEPAVCSDCGAVYHQGRWQWIAPPAQAAKARCSACERIHDNMPAGYVSIRGEFAKEHRDELLKLIHHLEEREKTEHPLQRIMAIDMQDDIVTITTTDIHLARGIGEALHHAYQGELDFHHEKGDYHLRVRWER